MLMDHISTGGNKGAFAALFAQDKPTGSGQPPAPPVREPSAGEADHDIMQVFELNGKALEQPPEQPGLDTMLLFELNGKTLEQQPEQPELDTMLLLELLLQQPESARNGAGFPVDIDHIIGRQTADAAYPTEAMATNMGTGQEQADATGSPALLKGLASIINSPAALNLLAAAQNGRFTPFNEPAQAPPVTMEDLQAIRPGTVRDAEAQEYREQPAQLKFGGNQADTISGNIQKQSVLPLKNAGDAVNTVPSDAPKHSRILPLLASYVNSGNQVHSASPDEQPAGQVHHRENPAGTAAAGNGSPVPFIVNEARAVSAASGQSEPVARPHRVEEMPVTAQTEGSGVAARSTGPESVTVPRSIVPPPHLQLAEAIRGMINRDDAGRTHVRLQLQPESLGEVVIRLVYKDGNLSTHFHAASEGARQIIESSLGQLRETLAGQQLNLQHTTVSSGGEERGGQEWNHGRNFSRPNGHVYPGAESETPSGPVVESPPPGVVNQLNYFV